MKLLVSRDGPVATMIINRPERRNAVDPETALALRGAFRTFEEDEEAAVAVLAGAGGAFCAGWDLKSLAEEDYGYDGEGEGPLGPTRSLLSKPVIAAVEGHAVAGGLELALWCDLRVASATAVFGVFCRRWGVPLIDGGTVRLPRIVGQGRALDMILTGRPVGAEEALAMGLANRVVPRGTARREAEALAHQLTRFPQICMRADRRSAYEQWDRPLDLALHGEWECGLEAIRAGETLAGASRFAAGHGRSGSFDDL